MKEASCTYLIFDSKLLKVIPRLADHIHQHVDGVGPVAQEGAMPFDVHGGRVESLESVVNEFQLEPVIRGQHVRRMETGVGADGIPFLPKFKQAILDHQKAIGSQEDGVPSSCIRANELDVEGKFV